MDPKALCARMKVFSIRELFLALMLASLGMVVIIWTLLSSSNSQLQLASVKLGGSWKWIIADASTGLCGLLQAPPEWAVLYVGETAEQNQTDQSNSERTRAYEQFFYDPFFLREKRKDTFGPAWKKNAASLRAIAEGATQVLVTDCSTSLTEAIQVLHVQHYPDHGLLYNETLLFNPYAHFGAWALAPRAALSTGLWTNSRLYYVRDFSKVLLRHVLSDQSTDAVLMLPDTAGSSDGRRFDPSSPPVYVGQRSFSPVLSGCTLYHREAFWALLDPCPSNSPNLHCPVVWTLLRQRLLRELDAFSGYFQANSSHINPRTYVSDKTLYSAEGLNLAELATFLSSWECEEHLSFYACFRNLAHDLSTEGYVNKQEKTIMNTWITALEKLKVEEPVRMKSPWRGVRTVNEIRVTLGSVKTRLGYGGSDEEAYLSRLFTTPVKSFCKYPLSGAHMFLNVSHWKAPLMNDVVLIIVFNENAFFWRNFYILEATHRPFFKHMVYCVADIDQLVHGDKVRALSHVVVLEGLTESWSLMYGCVTHVMEMSIPGVQGYMQIGDDVLFNSWLLLNESRDVMLLHECGQLRTITKPVLPWSHWTTSMGRCAVLRTLAGLEHISGLDSLQLLGNDSNRSWNQTYTDVLQSNPQLYSGSQKCPLLPGSQDWPEPTRDQARRFLLNYYHVHKMAGKVRINGQDFLYIPHSVATDYIPVSRYFMKNMVMVELAVYNIQMGMSTPDKRKTVQGTNSWGPDRLQYENDPAQRYSMSGYYMHPFKLARLPQHQKVTKFFCQVHLRNLFSELVKGREKK